MSKEHYLGLKEHQQKDYRSPFTRWDESSWIRSKPIRKNSISGLPFSPELVPLASHEIYLLQLEHLALIL